MDNQDKQNKDETKELRRMQALAAKYAADYIYGKPCVPHGSTDSSTPLNTEFFGVRMLNGDIHNLTGMHRADRMVADRYITPDGNIHTTLSAPSQPVLNHYLETESEVDCIVVLKMLPFTEHATFYTNDWSRPIAAPITPLVEVVAELSDITIETRRADWEYTLAAYPIPSGQYDLTEVIA